MTNFSHKTHKLWKPKRKEKIFLPKIKRISAILCIKELSHAKGSHHVCLATAASRAGPLQARRSGGCRRSAWLSKEYKAQLEAEYQARLKAEQKAWLEAEQKAQLKAEYKVWLQAEQKARPEAEYTEWLEQFTLFFALPAGRRPAASIDIGIAISTCTARRDPLGVAQTAGTAAIATCETGTLELEQ